MKRAQGWGCGTRAWLCPQSRQGCWECYGNVFGKCLAQSTWVYYGSCHRQLCRRGRRVITDRQRTFLASQLRPGPPGLGMGEGGGQVMKSQGQAWEPGEADRDTGLRLPLCRKGKRVALGLWPCGGSVPVKGAQDFAWPLAVGSSCLSAMVGSRPWGQEPREPLLAPNCFVYEALLRASSGFPNELVCCGVSAAELVITSETGGLRL